MLKAEAIRNDANDGYVMLWTESASFSHAIQGELAGFLELLNSHRRGAGNEVYFDAGLKYKVGSNMQFDGGFNAGLTHQAEDWRVFPGFSWRQ